MRILQKPVRASFLAILAVTALLVGGCSTMERTMEKMGIGDKKATTAELTGKHEVPPVSTKAAGKSTITVANDKSVSGTVIVTDMTPTAAHIHHAAPGANGPVVVPLTKTGDKSFSVPANTKLTDEQYAAFKSGNLYINVHSAAYPNGEIRVQMKPM